MYIYNHICTLALHLCLDALLLLHPGVGVELDSSLFERAKRNAKRIPDINAKFLQRDLMAPDLDLSEATVMWVSSP